MKKLANLSGAMPLNKTQQKQIFGGTTLTHYDPNCDIHENQYKPGCPCLFDTQCANIPIETLYGYTLTQGTCTNGECVVV